MARRDSSRAEIDEIIEHATQLVQDHEKRVQLQRNLEKLYRLDSADPKDAELESPRWIRDLKDPSPHETIEWSSDVLSIHEPQISVEVPDVRVSSEEGAEPEALMGVGPDGLPAIDQPGPLASVLPGAEAMPGPAAMTQSPDELAEIMENVARRTYRDSDWRSRFNVQRDLVK